MEVPAQEIRGKNKLNICKVQIVKDREIVFVVFVCKLYLSSPVMACVISLFLVISAFFSSWPGP
jgi:hypothetical protein